MRAILSVEMLAISQQVMALGSVCCWRPCFCVWICL